MPKKRARAQEEVEKIVERKIINAATKFRKAPYEVMAGEFWTVINGEITEWEVRKYGGFTPMRKRLFPVPPDIPLPRSHPKKFVGINTKLTNFTTYKIAPQDLFVSAGLKDDEIFRLIVMPDTHVPEHDPAALEAFLQFGEWYKPHGIINIGDFMEMEAVSHWPARDMRPRRLVPHMKQGRNILQEIDNRFGKQLVFKYFLVGNHEDWLEQYIVAKVPELFYDLDDLGLQFGIAELLNLNQLGYTIIPLNKILAIGEHCHFIHGYYTNKYHASKHLEVFGVNLYYGHLHDVQSISQVSVKGIHEAMSLGCLRDFNAHFLKGKPNNWSHAFGIFEFRRSGEFTRYVPIMVNGKFSFAGKVFDGNKQPGKHKTEA